MCCVHTYLTLIIRVWFKFSVRISARVRAKVSPQLDQTFGLGP